MLGVVSEIKVCGCGSETSLSRSQPNPLPIQRLAGYITYIVKSLCKKLQVKSWQLYEGIDEVKLSQPLAEYVIREKKKRGMHKSPKHGLNLSRS